MVRLDSTLQIRFEEPAIGGLPASSTTKSGSFQGLGQDRFGSSVANTGNPSSPFSATTSQMMRIGGATNETNQRIANTALSMVGKPFNPGQKEQCQAFVNEVLKQAGFHNLPVASNPIDGHSSGENLANRFADPHIANINENPDPASIRPGEIVFFQNTYGSWGPGTITHVAISTGNGQCVHRATSGGGTAVETAISTIGKVRASADISRTLASGATNT